MTSLVLSTATRFLLPLMLLFSLFLLFRGHNDPGGGFVGGLVAATGVVLYALAYGVETAQRLLRVHPRVLIAIGSLCALGSGALACLSGRPFLTGLWSVYELPVVGKVGTPLVFDVGVYVTVVGVTLLIIFSLAEE